MGAITVSSLRGRRLAIGAGLAVLLLACAMSFTVFAHPGRTDSNGGHYDRETGEYHYHHGFEAHQHVNGECPFDFVDLTGQNSGGDGDGRSHVADSNSAKSNSKEIPVAMRIIMAVMISPIAITMLIQVKLLLLSVLKIEQDNIDWTVAFDWISSVLIVYGLISPGGIFQNDTVVKFGIALFIAPIIGRFIIKIWNYIIHGK